LCFTVRILGFLPAVIEQLNVASLSRPTVSLQHYSSLLLRKYMTIMMMIST